MIKGGVSIAIATGAADGGFGIRAEAQRIGLGFVPLIRERFDLVIIDSIQTLWSDLADSAPGTVTQVRGAANPVAGPYFNFSLPEPTGVVAVLAPEASSLLGFVSVVAPAVVSGNTVVVVATAEASAAPTPPAARSPP